MYIFVCTGCGAECTGEITLQDTLHLDCDGDGHWEIEDEFLQVYDEDDMRHWLEIEELLDR